LSQEGQELEEEQLEAVTGGGFWDTVKGCFGCAGAKTTLPSPSSSPRSIPNPGLDSVPEEYPVGISGYVRSLSGRQNLKPDNYVKEMSEHSQASSR
jgi:hypothetical protein